MVTAWRTPNSRTAVTIPFQHGKEIAHDTPVWTEAGWKTHGELRVGDYVYSSNGMPVRVEALSPDTVGDYQVEFSDGAVIHCHEAHEWLVYSRNKHRWCILETRQLADEELRDRKAPRYNISVPRTLPLITAPQDLIVPPYVLGAWLGDGSTGEGTICHSGDDWEVLVELVTQGYIPSRRWIHKPTGVHYSSFPRLRAGLKEIGVLDNKHIPAKYLSGAIEQRLDLLAGLIDTDGNYSEARGSGQYRFTNTNKELVNQVAFLARTLGFKVGLQEYEPALSSSGIHGRKVVYVVAFSPTRPIPCRIPRKKTKKLSEACRVAITKVSKCEPKPGRCIQVEGGLYLVGEHLTPTHNSWLCSIYFPAWVLLRWPDTRIALASYGETFAENFGGKVRDVVRRYGPQLGIHLRDDTDAKGEWVIAGQEGGMICRGRGGALTGRPADLLILDDMLKDHEEAQSPTILSSLWDWYCTVAYSRLGPKAPIIAVGTRWGPKDLFGRLEAEAKVGGDKFNFVSFKAIAGKDDILGRHPGEALWPDRVPLERLERIAKTRPRWFKACWQGEPEEIAGLHFQPKGWPKYIDTGDAWRVHGGAHWSNYRKVDCTIVIIADWAQSGKKKSDHTAIVTSAITPDGLALVLDVFNERLRYEENAPALARICKMWCKGPDGALLQQIVASDDDTLSDAMAVECRRYWDIPEIKILGIRNKAKIIRAQAGIIRSQNGLFLLPDPPKPWYEEMADQLSAFTGEDGNQDDIADCFGILGRIADEFMPGTQHDDCDPVLGSSGYLGAGGW